MTDPTKILAQIEAAIEKATPGKWGFVFNEACTPSTNHEPIAYWVDGYGPATYSYSRSTFIRHNDARYIEAVKPTNMAALLAYCRGLEAALRLIATAEKSVHDIAYVNAVARAALRSTP